MEAHRNIDGDTPSMLNLELYVRCFDASMSPLPSNLLLPIPKRVIVVVCSNCQFVSVFCLSDFLFILGRPGGHLLGKSCSLGFLIVSVSDQCLSVFVIPQDDPIKVIFFPGFKLAAGKKGTI